ncbi:alkaline phosphatase family protein [Paraburkholderia megapolitana]|uniref:alkaline phosphatase family protein n=1 Tax=Paraburkholderia megapolitana TaxID=420953 RepID=UPI0038B74FE4
MGKLVWLLVDGLPYDLVARFSAQLPTLASALREGRTRRLRPAFPNCQTPPSLASLFTGEQPAETGLTGYFIPRVHADDPLGFDDAFLLGVASRCRFLWEIAAGAGASVRLLHVPFVDAASLGTSLRLYCYGFVRPALSPAIHTLKAGEPMPFDSGCETAWHALWQHDSDVVLLRCADGREHLLSTSKQIERVQLSADLVTELCQVEINGTRALIVLGIWRPHVQGDARQVEDYRHHMRGTPFFGSTFSRAYRAGALGKTLHDGGDGAAECLFVHCLERLAKRYAEDCLFAAQVAEMDCNSLVLAYQPVMDLALHELLGFASEGCAYATDAARAVVEPLLCRLLTGVDTLLAELLRMTGPDTDVLLSADHGMLPIDTLLYPNVLLREYGWLVLTEASGIDPERSACFYHPSENGLLVFNRETMRKQGITAEQIADRLLAGIAQACGRPAALLECAIVDSGERWMAYHYLRPPACIQAKAEAHGAEVLALSRKTGDHCVQSDASALEGFIADLRGRVLPQQTRLQTWEVGRYAQRRFAKEETDALVE